MKRKQGKNKEKIGWNQKKKKEGRIRWNTFFCSKLFEAFDLKILEAAQKMVEKN